MKRFMVWAIALVFLFCTSGFAFAGTAEDEKLKETKAAYDKAVAEKKAADKKAKAPAKKAGEDKAKARTEVPPAASGADSTKTTR